ncbi:MAG TPA: carbamoyltransferase C-terminal domain-containing protein [Burkholderiaceae bacterium]|nr:carbamoyltransferase C-terminal domain-containing protein [Burkholderiaceae bacterium]
MITLGINAAFHDSSAAIVRDGQLIAAAEEERFTRIKHAKRPLPFTAWELPYNAIDFCLARCDATLNDVDHVAYSYDPKHFLNERLAGDSSVVLPLQPNASESEWENPWDPLFASYIVNAPGQLRDGAPHHLRARFLTNHDARYAWHFVNHHMAHQASAFLAAPFKNCAVMTLDGRGEQATTTYGVHQDSTYTPLGEVTMPHSLGLLYERVTSHLGFLHSSDEYKVMALAAMGEPRYAAQLRKHVHVEDAGQYRIDRFDLGSVFGPARHRGEPIEQRHFDVAASLQKVLEETVLALTRWLRDASGSNTLAMAGGVALNCVMNSTLRDAKVFDEVWIQPAAGDAGTALGAALWIDSRSRNDAHSTNGNGRWHMQHAYWGPDYDDLTLRKFLDWAKLPYRALDDPAADVADILASDRIIGWFQGRMEFGPRALGARSIIASPLSAGMQERLNELKDREDFRPVAPAVPVDDFSDWFEPSDANGGISPFMLFVYRAREGRARQIPAACHVDDSARVQTVAREDNPRFFDLLKAFGQRTGVPVLVNTSFNVRGEPIVCTPRDAIDAFYSTPLDALVIGNYLLEKH